MIKISNKNTKKMFAFTLAEVLITLGIIGVVAAITIPSLMHKIYNKELEASFKKTYSGLSQALLKMRADEGSIWASYNYRDNGAKPGWSQTNFHVAFMKYLSVMRDCGVNSCITDGSNYYRNYSNTGYYDASGIDIQKQFILSDGVFVAPVVYFVPDTLIAFTIDTNGYSKKPNRAGYDVFIFELSSKDVLVPEGAMGTQYEWAKDNYCDITGAGSTIENGYTCAYRAMLDPNYFNNLP